MRNIHKVLPFALLINAFSFSIGISGEQPVPQTIKPVQDEGKFLVYGDFLWWRADANDMPLAIREEVQVGSSPIVEKKMIGLNGKWDPGFRVGAGYHFGFYDKLDLLLTYTRFHGESKYVSESENSLGTTLLRQTWIPFLGPVAFAASGQWKTGLDTGDIEIARNFNSSNHLSFRPHAGVRLAWIDYKYQANYTGAWVNPIDTTVQTQDTSMSASSAFNAGGLRAGSQFLWKFCQNLGLFGDISSALLYGHFKVHETFNGADDLEAPTLISLTERFKEDMNGVRVNLEVLLGVKGWIDFCDHYRFSLFAGYELSEWFRVNELFQVVRSFDPNDNASFSTIYSSNDIGFQGFTLKAGLDF